MIMLKLSLIVCCFSLVFAANGKEADPDCDCVNPVYLDQPTNIVQCYSPSRYVNMVNTNFDMLYALIDQESACDCDYTEYRAIIAGMKKGALNLVDAYFKCKEHDCLPAIRAVQAKNKEFTTTRFVPFLACSFVNLPPECLANVKHATYYSAENALMTMTACANLKKSGQRPDIRVLIADLFTKKTPVCNCITIDPRPIPTSKEQCFSAEYVNTVDQFITNNYKRMKRVYRDASNANPQCDFSPFVQMLETIEGTAREWKSILQQPNPTFKKLDGPNKQMLELVPVNAEIIRKRVLEGEKACYVTPRRLRQAPAFVANYVLQMITACLDFADPTNSTC